MMLALALTGCEEPESSSESSSGSSQELSIIDGDAQRGAALIRSHGCPSCHTIPGVQGARGIVGPSLRDFAVRAYIAGSHPNTPDNLVRWIMNPPQMVPETAMPDMDIPQDQARHIAAYLYTLR